MLTKSELTKLVGNSAGKKILCVGPDQGDVNMDDVPESCLVHNLDYYVKDVLKGTKNIKGDFNLAWDVDNDYDCVIMSFVLEHTLNPKFLIEQAHKVLKKGGTCFVRIPIGFAIADIVQVSVGEITDTPQGHYYFFNLQDILKKMYDAGFIMSDFRMMGFEDNLHCWSCAERWKAMVAYYRNTYGFDLTKDNGFEGYFRKK